MIPRRYLVIVCLLMAPFLQAQGSPELAALTGVVSVKGSEPTSYIALTTDNNSVWHLTGTKAEELKSFYQNCRVTIFAKKIPPRKPLDNLLPPTIEVVEYRFDKKL